MEFRLPLLKRDVAIDTLCDHRAKGGNVPVGPTGNRTQIHPELLNYPEVIND